MPSAPPDVSSAAIDYAMHILRSNMCALALQVFMLTGAKQQDLQESISIHGGRVLGTTCSSPVGILYYYSLSNWDFWNI